MTPHARLVRLHFGHLRLDIAQRLRPLFRAAQRVLRWLGEYSATDERTAYLSMATSHADLERRIRAYEDHDRQRHLTFRP